MKAARKKARKNSVRSHRHSARDSYYHSKNKTEKRSIDRMIRVNVRAPNVRVTTPAPQVSVHTPIPTVQIEAPKPLIIPPPIVHVDVEKEENTEEASFHALRKELRKCKKENQSIELILTSDWGPDSRDYRRGTLVRVDEGLIELRSCATLPGNGQSILIPLNRIVAVIPNLQNPSEEAATKASEATRKAEPVLFPFVERTGEQIDRHLASG
ncbi:hypothetical protein [Brevibacillus reuszeri]|uniref:hypothetical protein n=1 Tax=Brevibacillus reuszeri TaxID=54915 RepID=UPI0028977126|nr:hypothetical protein [Brevibacillus reuszeri]